MVDPSAEHQGSSPRQRVLQTMAPICAEAVALQVVTTASNPTTPGPSTPTTMRNLPFERSATTEGKSNGEIIPPTRPSSTPFPLQLLQPANRRLEADLAKLDIQSRPQSSRNSRLCALPIEIHECILDYLFGVRRSASSRFACYNMKGPGSWSTGLRHSRRREVSDLALVSNRWRELIQERLYRHLKIRGTRESVSDSMLWFFRHPHLCDYVKHIEIWYPIFQQKFSVTAETQISPRITPEFAILNLRGLQQRFSPPPSYQLPPDNCSLDETFRFIDLTFSNVCVLTLEGGERKKPPMVQHFPPDSAYPRALVRLPTIRTLICKSQWNLIRSNEDFQTIVNALPNLTEWHGSYAKPKSKSYLSMAQIFPKLPSHLTRINICLEADYLWEAVAPSFSRKINKTEHFCVEMAKSIPTLESFGYTGRVCSSFFDTASSLSDSRASRLKSVDIVVKNVCRHNLQWNDGSGTTDIAFILAFEKLVLAGIRATKRLTSISFLRVRFIDLGSHCPPPNPYFQLEKDTCTGLWSEKIVEVLAKSRPAASFAEKPPMIIEIESGENPKPKARLNIRPVTIRLSNYVTSMGGITII